MTPLAQRLVRDLTLPAGERRGMDEAGVMRLLSDIHCFDVAAVFTMARDLGRRLDDASVGASDYLTFLPAPRTWIEHHATGGRLAYLLVESPSKDSAAVYCVAKVDEATNSYGHFLPGGFYSTYRLRDLALRRPHIVPGLDSDLIGPEVEKAMGMKEQALIYALLLIINSPKVIGRKQHLPHRGLQRKLAKRFGSGVGKFAVNAWTEITLHVSTRDASEEGEHEDHLTGHRALHWVRTFGRIRLGRLEIVRSHWRGDAALGIKQSRYTVRP